MGNTLNGMANPLNRYKPDAKLREKINAIMAEPEQHVKYILSMDGGGVKGLYTARLLDKIAEMLNTNIQTKFNMFVGTSIGGMVAIALAQADDNTKLKCEDWFSMENIKTIFNKTMSEQVFNIMPFKPKYDGIGKKKVISMLAKNEGLDKANKDVAVTTFQVGNFSPHVFCSWEHKDNARVAADMTSAAPLYFPGVSYNNNVYLDGGIGVNNPVLIAYTKAKERYPGCRIKILSIGTGSWFPKFTSERVEEWGAIQWLKNGLIDMLFSASCSVNDVVAKGILQGDFLRINNKGLVDILLDETEKKKIDQLRTLADESFALYKDDLKNFFKD